MLVFKEISIEKFMVAQWSEWALTCSSELLQVADLSWSYIFYVESIARGKKLSLSALLLYMLHQANKFCRAMAPVAKEVP